MKSFVAALICSQAAAFSVLPKQATQTALYAGDYEPLDGESKINLKVSTLDRLDLGTSVLASFVHFWEDFQASHFNFGLERCDTNLFLYFVYNINLDATRSTLTVQKLQLWMILQKERRFTAVAG